MPTCSRLVSRSWQWRLDLVHHAAVCSSECTCSWESINVKTVNYFTVHQSMSEKREFSEEVLNQLWVTAPFCAMNLWVWEVYFIYFFFHRAGAQQRSARHLAGYASVVMRAGFRHPHSSCCPLEFEHRPVLPPRRHTYGAGQLFICSSPQLAGVLRSTLAVSDITILVSGEALPGRKFNKATQFSAIIVRYFNLGQFKTEDPR